MQTQKTSVVIGCMVLILLAVIAGVIAMRGKNADTGSIKIGSISALTGVGISIGEEERKGALLAVEEINAKGGVRRKKLELVSEDVSIDKIKVAASVAQKLVAADKVVAIVGPQWDETAFPILPIIEQAQVPMIGADSTPGLEAEKNYEYFFSTWYDNRVGIRELLRFAQKKNIKTVAIIKPIAAGFWEFTAQEFKKEAPAYGITVVDEVDMGNPLLLDFRTSLTKVKAKNPQAIFAVTSDYNQCTFLKQAEEIGYQGITFGTESSGDPTSLSQCSHLLEKRFFSTPVQTDEYALFAERFNKRFGQYPRYPSASTAYDAVKVIATALDATHLQTGPVLRDAIAATKNLKGVALSSVSFNDHGFISTPENAFEIHTAKNGVFVKAP